MVFSFHSAYLPFLHVGLPCLGYLFLFCHFLCFFFSGHSNVLLGRRRKIMKISLTCRSSSERCWLCQVVASTPAHWHLEKRSISSLVPTAVSSRTDSFVSFDSDGWSTLVTYELPSPCITDWLFKLTTDKQQVPNFPAQREIPLYCTCSWGWGILKDGQT